LNTFTNTHEIENAKQCLPSTGADSTEEINKGEV